MKKMFAYLISITFVVVLGACSKDQVDPSEFDYVNSWIYDNMKEAYYWTDRIPASPNKAPSPDIFFQSLLLKPNDRFSWIQDNYQELLNSLQGVSKEAGYEFALYRASSANNNVLAQVLYVKKGSPAELAGLNRGDVIDQINSQQITMDNYKALLQSIGEPHSITYRPYNPSTNTVGLPKTISLATVEYTENPNFLDKVITVNNRKIGYYVYNLFTTGPIASSVQYNEEMDAVFARFKAEGITDLVLDLRFNSGGAETATVNLASLIGKGVDANKIFAKRQYNSTLTTQILNDPKYGAEFLLTRFKSKTQNVGSMLRNNRVYILTGTRTASASELLINGLKPFMEVFLIGAKTLGKNVGSTTIYEANNPKNKWGMQPIIVKSFNSLDQSDYGNGFTPNIEDADNGTQLPLGDPNEKLLGLAIQHISNGGRIAVPEKTVRQLLGYSFEFKRRNSDLVIDPKGIFF
jgi:carboxyl-terminal processing protease